MIDKDNKDTVDNTGRELSSKFQKGISGNPNGRPKGSKNKTTLIRQAIEADMVETLSHSAPQILLKTIEKALEGDTACIKILMDRLLPARKASDDETKVGGGNIVINVSGMSKNNETTIQGEIIENE